MKTLDNILSRADESAASDHYITVNHEAKARVGHGRFYSTPEKAKEYLHDQGWTDKKYGHMKHSEAVKAGYSGASDLSTKTHRVY